MTELRKPRAAPQFTDNAPADVVEKIRQRRKSAVADIEQISVPVANQPVS